MAIQDAIPKLSLLLPKLASDSSGEIVATVTAIQKVLKSNNTDLHDLVALIGKGHSSGGNGYKEDRYRQDPPKQKAHEYTSAKQEDYWMMVAKWCEARVHQLNEREHDFIINMVENLKVWGTPTEKQGAWLKKIYTKLGGKVHEAKH